MKYGNVGNSIFKVGKKKGFAIFNKIKQGKQ